MKLGYYKDLNLATTKSSIVLSVLDVMQYNFPHHRLRGSAALL